jgi:3-oxoacyl-[acyl-carrier protein] reductase
MGIEGRVAIVTGSASGIGKGVAELLAEEGADVVLADINIDGAQAAASEIIERGYTARALFVDVGSPDSIGELIKEIQRVNGKIDILVNNAGVFNAQSVADTSVEEWDRIVDTNLRGAHLFSQAVIKIMMANRYGRIVNIGSMAGLTGGLKAGVAYASSKAGIHGMTKCYARYGAPYGVRVNGVAPGLIETDMTKDWATIDDIPLQRLGTPLDVARVVFFLVTELSDYVTGQILSVDGGIVMR